MYYQTHSAFYQIISKNALNILSAFIEFTNCDDVYNKQVQGYHLTSFLVTFSVVMVEYSL